jgi:iron complex outermembrane receptor protein
MLKRETIRLLAMGPAMMALSVGLAATGALAAPTSSQIHDPEVKQTRAERSAKRKAVREARRSARAGKVDAHTRRIEGSPTVAGGDIIVTGIRQSVQNSIDRKHRARQIVDVVTAEDAGKLPDNNVVEAMARVTGVTVTRSQGRANGYNIRGLDGVQTTVNGVESSTAPLPGGAGRTLALESVPAELVKSIEVYKTRTADQIEGGIGGSVNIELRRPLDLRKGWTVAGDVKGQYGELGKLWSPSGSLLVAKRFDTGIGEMGFLINGAYSKRKYKEAYNYSESPDLVGCATCVIRASLPAGQRDTVVAPYRAAYGENSGEREQKSLSAAVQWRPSSKLSFVLEGSYFGEESSDQFNSLFLRTREDYYTLRNVRVSPGGALLGYDILNLPTANGSIANFGKVNAGFTGGRSDGKANTYRTNFETHFESPGIRVDFTTQYQWSNNQYYSNGHVGTYLGLTSARVDFDSPAVKGNGPFFAFNVSPTDPALARLESLNDNIGAGENTQFSAQTDLWKELSSTGLFRSAKLGARFTRNTYGYNSSYRFAGWFDPVRQPLLSALPGVGAVTITPELPGGSPLSWVQLNSDQLYNNWPAVTKFITANNPEFLDGIGRDAGVASLFGTDRPNADDIVYSSQSKENTFAAYATVDYAFKAAFPIDGNVGLRYVNTYGSITGRNLQLGAPILSPTGQPTGVFGPDVVQDTAVNRNYVDLLPSAFATVHFTDKMQLRGSYSYNVQRPSLFDLRNWRQIDYRNPGSPVYAGNPALVPTTTNDYNLALEWYFGKGGIISLTGFSKNQKGFIYNTRQREFVPELGDTRDVYKTRNAGPGKTQGLEFQATGFFTFLPGFLRNFGATANATWIPTADLSLPVEAAIQPVDGPTAYDLVKRRAPFASRWSYNLIGYYETAMFSARLAYNWRSEYQTAVDAVNQSYIISSRATGRLDSAVNLTPVKYLTFTIEAQNMLNAVDKSFYFINPDLPNGVRAMGRTVTAGARFRF